MPGYFRVQAAINSALPELLFTQKINLALLVSAILKKQTLCLSELARAYPVSAKRRVKSPKHCLLHRLKRLWRFTDNERVNAVSVQMAFVAHTVARLGYPRLLGLAIDWTLFDTTLPSGDKIRYQVLRIAVPRKGRALPLLQLAYDRDRLPPQRSQNQLEQDALLAVVEALPAGVRPVILADRGFCRAGFLAWLEYQNLDYVVRLTKGVCITEADGKRWKLGEEYIKPGQLRFRKGVRYGLYHGRPRELLTNVALCWKLPKSRSRDPRRRFPEEPWYLATSLKDPRSAANWCCQLVLAAGLDRAVIQGRKEPFRAGPGAGRFCRASVSPFDGADHSPLVADAHGIAGGWSHAAALACEGSPAWESECHQCGLGVARPFAGLTVLLLTSIFARCVGGYASAATSA